MPVYKFHVKATEQDVESATRKSVSDCLVHRAVMRAVGTMFHPDQVQVGGHDDLGFYIQILNYKHVMLNKEVIGNPNFDDAERQWEEHRQLLATAPMWNRQVAPDSFFLRLGDARPHSKLPALGRDDINQCLWFWDNGYTVPTFEFDFEVELRPEWDYHQMDLWPWWEERGVDTGKEIIKQIDEALLAERLGVMEEELELAVAL